MTQGSGFAGKRCLLTGAASGIGRATALRLAADGAELFLTDRDAEGLETTVADVRALGAQVTAHRALDISDYGQVAAFGADIHSALGGPTPALDVVMNIAGVSRARGLRRRGARCAAAPRHAGTPSRLPPPRAPRLILDRDISCAGTGIAGSAVFSAAARAKADGDSMGERVAKCDRILEIGDAAPDVALHSF